MRDIVIIIIILVVIFGGDILIKKYLNSTADMLSSELEDLKQKTLFAKENENRDEIKKLINNIKDEWEKKNKIWSMVVFHQELDNIEQALERAESSIENGNLEDALQEIETANFFVKHVKEREKLSLKNIF